MLSLKRRFQSVLAPKWLLVWLPFTWLLLLFLLPFFIVLQISFSAVIDAIPPYSALWQWLDDGLLRIELNLGNYLWLIEDDLYWRAYASSVKIALISTAISLCVAYPLAYAMAKAPVQWRLSLLMLVILPFWTSFLIRVYAWIGILKPEGFLNHALQWLGLIETPLQILNTEWAVYIGIVYSYLPFMVLPLYASLERINADLLEAAQDLGATPLAAFWKVTFPLSLPGVVAGCFLVFIPAVGEFVIPDLLGGSDTLMIGRVLWSEFFANRDWPVASAVAIVLLLILIVPIVYFQRQQQAQAEQEAAAS